MAETFADPCSCPDGPCQHWPWQAPLRHYEFRRGTSGLLRAVELEHLRFYAATHPKSDSLEPIGERTIGRSIPYTPRPKCRYFGEVVEGDFVACAGCGSGVRLKVFVCGVHGRCTPARKAADVACCDHCDDYRPVEG